MLKDNYYKYRQAASSQQIISFLSLVRRSINIVVVYLPMTRPR